VGCDFFSTWGTTQSFFASSNRSTLVHLLEKKEGRKKKKKELGNARSQLMLFQV
jgi:hypothetical protein